MHNHYDVGISDFHPMVCFSTKCHVKSRPKRQIVYLSYKRFCKDSYLQDLQVTPFHVGDIFDSVDHSYWFCQTLLRDVIDFHAPIKKRIVKGNQVTYMNSDLRTSSFMTFKNIHDIIAYQLTFIRM